tara:strand:+ start:1317 stop:1742 length:426 start_codon:yes stop_codon:yes gene_type:complete
MIQLKFEERVKVWKDLRDELESHPRPFHRIVEFCNKLPVSSKKVNPYDPTTQTLPWHLLEQGSFCEYEIAQLCAYTLQLTDRFSEAHVEIHISKDIENNEEMYLVCLDRSIVLGYRSEVLTLDELPENVVSQKIYHMPPLQ